MRSFRRTCALVTIAAGATAIACSDPDFNTDLDTDGPPKVTMVTILSESAGETPTFCINGEGVKVNADLCPEVANQPGVRDVSPVMDAEPVGWFARVVFSELLDPDIERLEEVDDDGDGITDRVVGHLDESLPVELNCSGDAVAYDGFYDPSGNDVTFPPGPALVIQPLDFVATGTSNCAVKIKPSVADKEGIPVSDTNLMGPHQFGIAVMTTAGSDPADEAEGIDPAFLDTSGKEPVQSGPIVGFNAPVDEASLAGQLTMVDAAGNDVSFAPTVLGTAVELTLAGPLADNTAYTITVPAAGTIADIGGGPLAIAEDFTFSFTTGTTPSM